MSIDNKKKMRWIKHYRSDQKILLVGEGDFSFSACLARAFRSARNMVATSLLSERLLIEKHWSSEEHLETLERLGCIVLHKVDVHTMSYHHTLKHMKFNVVVFNFPHAGHFYGYTETDEELIEMHKDLLRGFFKSTAKDMLEEGGEVHVTKREDYPYNTWELEKLGAESGFVLKEKVWFEKGDYSGYHNKRGGDINCNKTFPLGFKCFTFKFSLHMDTNGDRLQKINKEHSHEKNDCASKIYMENKGDQLQKNVEHGHDIKQCESKFSPHMEDDGDQLEKIQECDHEINISAICNIGLGGVTYSTLDTSSCLQSMKRQSPKVELKHRRCCSI